MQSELVYDKFDKDEGIYDPTPVDPKYPKCDEKGNHANILRTKQLD